MYFYIYFVFVQVMFIIRYAKIEALNVRCTIIQIQIQNRTFWRILHSQICFLKGYCELFCDTYSKSLLQLEYHFKKFWYFF
jgi:hypothetical protein